MALLDSKTRSEYTKSLQKNHARDERQGEETPGLSDGEAQRLKMTSEVGKRQDVICKCCMSNND